MKSSKPDTPNTGPFLTGQLLVAMPGMSDPRFTRSVIYLCAHSASGAMGLVINRLFDNLAFPDLLEQLDIPTEDAPTDIRVHYGGPVESGRGFVLHSGDYTREATMMIDRDVGVTATLDVLRAIAEGHGPRHSLMALGYAGWAAGQLDSEIHANGWLTVPADPQLLFDADINSKWERAIGKLGISPLMLSTDAGHA